MRTWHVIIIIIDMWHIIILDSDNSVLEIYRNVFWQHGAPYLYSDIHPITWRADGEAEIGVGILYFAARLSGGIAVIWRAPVCVMTSQNSHRIVTEIVIFYMEGK